MAALKWRFVAFLAGLATCINYAVSNEKVRLVSKDCRRCICEAATGCDVYGTNCPPGSYGLFCITKDYWTDGKRPVIWRDDPGDEKAFQRCVMEPFCAAETVENYAQVYEKDCNNDNKTDCRDYHMMHVYGPSCTGPFEPVARMKKFNDCWDDVLGEEKLNSSSEYQTET